MQEEFDVHKYASYYFNHTYNVVLAWKDIRHVLIKNSVINEEEYEKINHLIVWHDNSKLSKEEFAGYGLKFFGEGRNDELFKKAWKHHKENNLHHHQSLKDYDGKDKICYLIEMICDWLAMGWEMDSLGFDYYEQNKDKIELKDEDKKIIENIFFLIKNSDCFSKHKVTEKEKTKILIYSD